MRATKRVEPAIDQMMGNEVLPSLMAKISGRLSSRATQVPTSAPMNPTPTAASRPPRE
jgi:hypothetical protein